MEADMKFGAEIAVNGVRPKWLADDVEIQRKDKSGHGDGWNNDCTVTVGALMWGDWVSHIRLPEDHFAYIAIAEGFEPWQGADAPPDDWNDGEVLLSNGCTRPAYGYRRLPGTVAPGWTRTSGEETRIIGYKKRVDPVAVAEPTTQPDTDPIVALLTEIRDLLKPKEIGIAYGVNEFGQNIRRAVDSIARGTVSFARHTRQPEPEPLTIRITGPQGSGKTRWAELIRNLPAALLGFPVPVVVDGEDVS
jgi:hypothetical protein